MIQLSEKKEEKKKTDGKIIPTVSHYRKYNPKCTVIYINFLNVKLSLLAHSQSWVLDLEVWECLLGHCLLKKKKKKKWNQDTSQAASGPINSAVGDAPRLAFAYGDKLALCNRRKLP